MRDRLVDTSGFASRPHSCHDDPGAEQALRGNQRWRAALAGIWPFGFAAQRRVNILSCTVLSHSFTVPGIGRGHANEDNQ